MSLIIANSTIISGTAEHDILLSAFISSHISGGDGFDLLIGDFLAGFSDESGTSLATAVNVDSPDNWIIAENPLLADVTVPSTMLLVSADAGRQYFYAVTVAAGQRITVDVDSWGTPFQVNTLTSITIFNPAQVAVANGSNTNIQAGGLGTLLNDSFATHVAATSGTYFIRIQEVQSFLETDSNFDGGEQFIVNLSVTGHAVQAAPFVDDDTLDGGGGSDLLLGIGGNDILNGDDGNDVLEGGSGNDVLTGGQGNDTLTGGSGADQMFGGLGDDRLIVTADDVLVDGSDGVDAADFSGFGSAVSIDLELGVVQLAIPVNFSLLNVEAVIGTGFDDFIRGTAGDNVFVGGAGGDTILGGDGVDHVDYSGSDAGITVLLATGITAGGHAQGDVLEGIENITGTDHDDLIFGSEAANVIAAGRGRDTVSAGSGNDSISVNGVASIVHAGAGNDTIRGSSDTIPSALPTSYAGEDGDDLIQLVSFVNTSALPSAARFVVDGGSGNDTLAMGFGSATLNMETGATQFALVFATNFEHFTGSSSADSVSGTAGNNLLNGGSGNDTLAGTEGDDTLQGADGNDVLTGGIGIDSLRGGFGDDALQGNDGADVIFGDSGNDTANGGIGSDLIDGSLGDDDLSGANLADTITGGDGNDILRGGLGLDQLAGGAQNDSLSGDAGADSLTGDAGNDTLNGGNQVDTLDGGDGADLLTGSLGRDLLTGGTGADIFIWNVNDFGTNLRSGADRITDFNQAEGDRIDLSPIDASTTAAGNNAFNFIGSAAFVNDGVGGRLRFVQEGGNTFVEGDRNGDGLADFAIRLDGLKALGSADFIL